MAPDPKKPELISTGEAARACGVSTQTIVNWIRQGRLRAATTGGGRFRVHADSLVEFLKAGGFEVPTELKAGPPLIYIIDDDPAWLAAARRQLSTIGQVETYPDGYRGLIAVAARPPAVVVLDMKMPGLDGAGVLNALRNDDATRSLPILVATSFEEEAALARRYGATAAVIKGSAPKLKEAVERLLV
ncbi:MAG: response regulator [Deltaproteobacteria bacterium]|nr:response regulator [Deltaproteobacteria bacterium]